MSVCSAVLDAISDRHGIVVFVHCGVLSVGIRAKVGLPSPFDMRFSNPVDVHSVALRFPQLNFVIPHFGAGYFREALMVAICARTSTSIRRVQIAGSNISRRCWIYAMCFAVRSIFSDRGGSCSERIPPSFREAGVAMIFETQVNLLFDLGVSSQDADSDFRRESHGISCRTDAEKNRQVPGTQNMRLMFRFFRNRAVRVHRQSHRRGAISLSDPEWPSHSSIRDPFRGDRDSDNCGRRVGVASTRRASPCSAHGDHPLRSILRVGLPSIR